MGEQRHRDIILGCPPWQRRCDRDPEIREIGRFSSSYLSPTLVWPGTNRYRLVLGREEPIYGGDIRSSYANMPRNSDEKYGKNQCCSGLNRVEYPFRPKTGTMGLVQLGESSEKRDGQWQLMSGFSESAMGSRKNSTFRKFQWDNLLGDNDKPIDSNSNRKSFGRLCDSGVVPMENDCGGSSRRCFNQKMEPTESSREYGVMEGRYPSSNFCGNFGVREKRSSIMDSIVDKVEGIDDSGFRSNLISGRRILLENDDSFVGYEKDVNFRYSKLNPENLQFVDDLGFQRHGHGGGSNGDGIKRIFWNPQESPDDQKLTISSNWNPYDETSDSISNSHGRNWSCEDLEQAMLENYSAWDHYQEDKTGNVIDELAFHENSLSFTDVFLSMPRQTKPYKSDVRQRLGPVRSVKHRLGPVQSVKNRLGPAMSVKKRLGGKRSGKDSKVKKKLPWVKIMPEKEDPEQDIDAQRMKFLDFKAKKYAKTEPPENSEEFKQMVQSAFFKFVKNLNENSANQRRYLEQGGAGSLKCCICGSSSKEFVDTLGLAQHTFFSCKIGSRSEHLGLYKAICVLMGWSSTVISTGRWDRQILPLAEASLLREDLIIWPPVVFIHNSSLANDCTEKRVIVTVDEFKNFLRDMGCDRWMTNFCRGKAANNSTMVVSFSGTFPGLQEAEKLHKLFSEKKHGRAEFQQISSSGCKISSRETQNFQADRVESVLYGYSGIASDLCMLDFETKKRCLVKSKKEIEAIADASLNTR